MYNYKEVPEYYTKPYDNMFCQGYPPPYLNPSQSNYHNLGMNGNNGLVGCNNIYPGKRPGMLGDYGPPQQGWRSRLESGVYPLDISVLRERRREYNLDPFEYPPQRNENNVCVGSNFV